MPRQLRPGLLDVGLEAKRALLKEAAAEIFQAMHPKVPLADPSKLIVGHPYLYI